MDDLVRFWNDMIGRLTGPLTFRMILQPMMAMIFATRDGLKDARTGRPLFFRTLFTNPEMRPALLAEGYAATSRIIVLAAIMDLTYQMLVFRWIYPVELIVVVLLLAFVPYLLMRGAVNRTVRWLRRRRPVVS